MSLISKFLVDEDAPSKLSKVDIPSSDFVGGVVPGSMGMGFPPQSAYGAMQPMYALFTLLILNNYFRIMTCYCNAFFLNTAFSVKYHFIGL